MSEKFNTLEDVIALARFAHSKQRDKAGMAYFDHPYRVMQSVQAQGAAPYIQMAAVLHDVTEDTPFTIGTLLDFGVPEAAVALVDLLDRHNSKERWLLFGNAGRAQDEFYYESIRNNPGALMIKLADIHDNTQQWRLSYLPPETQERLHKKYAKAKEMLLS